MAHKTAFRLKDKAISTIGNGTDREVLVNPAFNTGILLDDCVSTKRMFLLIDGFERALYSAIKTLLKAHRREVVGQGEIPYGEAAYFFVGYWTKPQRGRPRYMFSIANTPMLRSAAGLSGGGPRSPDYLTYPNERFLQLGWDEQQALIDRTLGPDWISLQAAIKPSAHDFGIVLPNLRGLLSEQGNVLSFFKEVINLARPANVSGVIGRETPQFLLWCFLIYLRRERVLLLPLRGYYVDLVGNPQARFFMSALLAPAHQAALDALLSTTENYQRQNQMRMARIAQTLFLSADVNVIGDVSPKAFSIVCDGILNEIVASPTYRDKVRDLARSAYDLLVGIWNDTSPPKQIVSIASPDRRSAQLELSPKETRPTLLRSKRNNDPFWYVEIPAGATVAGHPIPGYVPTDATQQWARIFRETFPHLKVKDTARFRSAGLHWLTFISGLIEPPARIEEIVRNRHINDLVSRQPGTFRHWLSELPISPGLKNDVISSLAQMFGIYLRIHGSDTRNPIEFDLDRFLAPQPRGKTPRTPLSPEMLLYLKEFNRRDDFAFSRGFSPLSWTTHRIALLRHYRRIVDPEDGELKMMWWPGLAVLLDLMLTIPLRGFQARWLDTGEGDEYVVDLHTLSEIPNPLPFAKKGRQMGVFTSFAKGLETSQRLLGLRITTNKRTVECDGRYGIPWCPDDLRDSLSMLTAWQRQYNPLSTPVRAEKETWATSFRNEEVTALIPQIFPLFRDPGSEGGAHPPSYQQVQTYWNFLCSAVEDELRETQKTSFRLTRDRTRGDKAFKYIQRIALFDLHTLRVSGITALIEAGLPPHFVQEIVGHAAIVMTLYYHKMHPGQVNRALSDAFESRELSLERIPEVLADPDGYDRFLLNSRAAEDALGREMLRSAVGNGTNQVLSHGICPAGDCRTGGEYMHSEKEHQPVPRAGACALCRYRLTGPMFLAGLVVNANKIMAELHNKGQEIARINDEIRVRRRDGKAATSFEARREVLHRELENLWQEWTAEQQYVQASASLLADYLRQRATTGGVDMPLLVAEGALSQLEVKTERRHPFHLKQMLAEASEFVPAERHHQAIGERDAFLNELLANNDLNPFLLRLPGHARLEAGNMLGILLANLVPDGELQALHDGLRPVTAFMGLSDGIRSVAEGKRTALDSLFHSDAALLGNVQ